MKRHQVSVGALLREGVLATLSDIKGLMLFGLPAAALIGIGWTVEVLFEEMPPVMTVVAELGLAYIAFLWQRRYLLGTLGATPQGSYRREEHHDFHRLAFRYIWRTAIFYLGAFLLTLLVGFPLVILFLFNATPENFFLFNAGFLAVLGLPILLGARFLLTFPACAVGVRMSWKEAWRLGKGHGLRLGLVLILFMLPFALFLLGFAKFVPPLFQENLMGLGLLNIGLGLLRVAGTFMALVSVAYLYRQLTTGVDAEVFD